MILSKPLKISFLSLIIILVSATSILASPNTTRLAGLTRYETAVAISNDGWTQSDYAILAYGENFPDAITATPLAKKYNAPILLTERDNLTNVVKQELIRLKTKNVFIVGGTGVVSQNVEDQLKILGISPIRLAGQDRYETAIKINEQLGNDITQVMVVTGEDFTDALSVAPIAAKMNAPMILVPNDSLPEVIKTYLESKSINKSYIIGNISDKVAQLFNNKERIQGSDKYQLNLAVLKHFDTNLDFKNVYLATGDNFADALTGSALSAKTSDPIVLVNNSSTANTSDTNEFINSKSPEKVKVLGGEVVVSPKTVWDYVGNNESDKNSPTLNNINFVGSRILPYGQGFSIEAEASDDLSGVARVTVFYDSPVRKMHSSFSLDYDALNNKWIFVTPVGFDEVGTWICTLVSVTDNAGNIRFVEKQLIGDSLDFTIEK